MDGVGGQRHAPAALPPGKTRHPLYSRLGGPQSRSGRAENLSLTGLRSLDLPGRSESLYRLIYPGSPLHLKVIFPLCVKGSGNFLTPHGADFWVKKTIDLSNDLPLYVKTRISFPRAQYPSHTSHYSNSFASTPQTPTFFISDPF
jgi:hypothetical protein